MASAYSSSDLFSFSIPKNKSDKALDLYVAAAKRGCQALGAGTCKWVLKSTQVKTFKTDAFLQEAKGRDPAHVVEEICQLMEVQLSSTNKSKQPASKKVADGRHQWNNLFVQNASKGTRFAGSLTETASVAAQMFSAQLMHGERERVLAQLISAINDFLQRNLDREGASWKLFGALQQHLCPVLRKVLRSISWRDIVENSTLFKAIFALFSSWVSASQPSKVRLLLTLLLLDPLVVTDNENFEVASKLGDCVLVTLVSTIDDQAQQFFRLKDQHAAPQKDEKGLRKMADKLHILRVRLGDLVRVAPAKQVWEAIKMRYCGKKTRALQKDGQDLSLYNLKVEDTLDPETYVRALGGLRATSGDITAKHRLFRGEQNVPSVHHHIMHFFGSMDGWMPRLPSSSSAFLNGELPPVTIRRLQAELSTLATSLPVDWGSSIFVSFDEAHMDVLKVAIIGPDKTPYKNGFFVFDVRIPPTYPCHPPKMLMRTTGGNTIRFNPNIYEDGYVCLSLLGTWSGPGWDPSYSTLLQLVLSIQSSIFVEEPYFNEPGYDSHSKTTWGQKLSAEYNRHIRFFTLKWAILDQLTDPPLGFERVAATHFNLKAKEIAQQIKEWEDLDSTCATIGREVAEKLGLPLREKKRSSRTENARSGVHLQATNGKRRKQKFNKKHLFLFI
eukprot:GEMP01021446.1.p1 GENE.GEMP01021446.1~~GEMP01021446.1.p1  ORF type:complete len:670 (+),score=116.50 GEMP01021446.1:57-2066(+)